MGRSCVVQVLSSVRALRVREKTVDGIRIANSHMVRTIKIIDWIFNVLVEIGSARLACCFTRVAIQSYASSIALKTEARERSEATVSRMSVTERMSTTS